ncbi:MAG: hypothetical protein FWD83_01760 [Promicromonosporaceae bacterium]|nr:hypothetical protein [Promicromonosporaceae bacterium]
MTRNSKHLNAVIAGFTLALGVVGCAPDRAPVVLDPAATLVSLALGWGDFHEGHRSVRVAYEDGAHRLWVTWETHDRTQFFVPDGTPLAASEVTALRALLDEQGIAYWDGYDSTWTDDNTSDFSFSFSAAFSDGATITAAGANDFGHRPTDNFGAEFAALANHLRGLAERHSVEPEWGAIADFQMTIGWRDPARYLLRPLTDGDYQLSLHRGRAAGTVTVAVGPDVLAQLQVLVDQLEVTSWLNGIPDAPHGGSLDQNVSVYVRFDSGHHLSTVGSVQRREDLPPSIDALVAFFEDQWIAHQLLISGDGYDEG